MTSSLFRLKRFTFEVQLTPTFDKPTRQGQLHNSDVQLAHKEGLHNQDAHGVLRPENLVPVEYW